MNFFCFFVENILLLCSSGGGTNSCNEATLTLTNCTVTGNSASAYGGGICNGSGWNFGDTVTLKNCVVALNSALISGNDVLQMGVFDMGTIQGYNNLTSFTDWSGSFGNNYRYDSAQLLFTDAANGDYTLAENSQAIDKGNNAYAVYPDGSAIEFDLAGNPRIAGGTVDLGAYERPQKETPSLVVTTNLDVVDSYDGVVSLREAITYVGVTLDDGSTLGTTVTFDASLAGKTIVLNGSQLVVDKGITIDASSLGEAGITIDADQKSRAFCVSGGTEETPVQFKNLTVTGGNVLENSYPENRGGGIYAFDVFTATDCVVSGNSASYGGGIYMSDVLTLTNCVISNNSATYGGGISNNAASSTSLTLTDCVISNNSATYGAGIDYDGLNGSETLVMTNCEVTGNATTNGESSYGGGVRNNGATLTLINCKVSNNTAAGTQSYGGGIFNKTGTLTLTGCSFLGNVAVNGGGIYNLDALTLTNCEIAGNSALLNGGGIYHTIRKDTSRTLTLSNCTVAGNSASSGGGIFHFYSTTSVAVISNSIVAMNHNENIDGKIDQYQNNIIGGAPEFIVAPEFNASGELTNADSMDLRLKSSSWAIDAGTNDAVAEGAVDRDGNPRIHGTNVDIGAYEYQETAPEREAVSLVVTSEEDSFDATDGKTSLREAIWNANDGETITFAPSLDGKTIALCGDEYDIFRNVAIDASSLPRGTTIDANQKSCVFYIYGGTEAFPVQLKNLTVTGGNASYSGGGIDNSGVLTLTDCTIAGNSASYGGGVYHYGASLTLTNCVISGNSSSSFGGGIVNGSTLTMANCSISNNTSVWGGGLYTYNTATLTNCKISDNFASNDGGGISNEGSLILANCTVSGNSVPYYGVSNGGGIYNSANAIVTLQNCLVALNQKSGRGNDIYQKQFGTPGSGRIQGFNNLTTFTGWKGFYGNNYVYDSTQPLFTDAANDDYSLAKNSQALDRGNNAYAVYPDGSAIEFDLAGNPRIFNKVVDIGAYEYKPAVYTVTTEQDVVDPDDGVLSLREAIAQADLQETVTFDASLAGKTIVLNGSQLVVDKGIIIDATSLGESGIRIDAGGKSSVLNVSGGTEDSPVTLKNLTLTGGKTAWYGGLLYTKDVVSVQNCKFNAGFAYYGGAIANEGTLTVENSSFNGNKGSHGGAIFNRSTGMLTLSGITATTNSATNYGGVLYNNGTATVTDSEFQQNSSKNRAGAIYVAAGTVSVAGSTFVDNTAANFGGAVYNAGTFDVSTSSITGGSAIYGGAIANFKTLTISACDLTNNSATKQGGGIYHSSSIAVNITAGSISDNSAYQGGGLYVRIGTVRLTGTELKSNSVTHNGGAIYSRNQTILTDCVVTANSAKYYGGGVYNEKILRVRGTTTVADNATGTGKSQDIHTKDGGQIIYDSALADSVFDETDDWTIEL